MKHYIDENGKPYAYEEDGSQDHLIGSKTPITNEEHQAIVNPPPTQAELETAAEEKFTSDIDTFIQDEVEIFNTTHGVKFSDIHNCKSFALTDGYFLQTECKAITDWAFLTVWETMRLWQQGLTSIPTDAEFQAELDKIPFNG